MLLLRNLLLSETSLSLFISAFPLCKFLKSVIVLWIFLFLKYNFLYIFLEGFLVLFAKFCLAWLIFYVPNLIWLCFHKLSSMACVQDTRHTFSWMFLQYCFCFAFLVVFSCCYFVQNGLSLLGFHACMVKQFNLISESLNFSIFAPGCSWLGFLSEV